MTVHANARSPFGTNYKLKRITQSGAQQWWSFKPAANNFGVGCTFVHSPQTRVRFYSSPDTTEFLTVEETPWRNCCVELLAGWNHEVSRCHSSFRRRLGELKCRKCAPSQFRQFRQVCVKCGAGDSESGSSWRRVSPGPSPACRLTDSVAVASPHEPMPQRLCDRDYKSSAYWLPVLTAPRPLPLIHRALPSTIFNETVVCACTRFSMIIGQQIRALTSYCAFC